MARIIELMEKWNYIAVRLYQYKFFVPSGDGRVELLILWVRKVYVPDRLPWLWFKSKS